MSCREDRGLREEWKQKEGKWWSEDEDVKLYGRGRCLGKENMDKNSDAVDSEQITIMLVYHEGGGTHGLRSLDVGEG